MAKDSPNVTMSVDQIVVRPGQTINLYVIDPDGLNVQVEVRSVGLLGDKAGRIEIYCDEIVTLRTFKGWTPMDVAVRERRAAVKLLEPKPPQPKEE